MTYGFPSTVSNPRPPEKPSKVSTAIAAPRFLWQPRYPSCHPGPVALRPRLTTSLPFKSRSESASAALQIKARDIDGIHTADMLSLHACNLSNVCVPRE